MGVAEANLASTLAARDSLLHPTAADLSQAEASFAASEASLNAALAERSGLDEPVSFAQLREAELSVTAAEATVAAAFDRRTTLLNPDTRMTRLLSITRLSSVIEVWRSDESPAEAWAGPASDAPWGALHRCLDPAIGQVSPALQVNSSM